ncbi:coiled-coil domain-containing protein 30 isoform X2 [Ornithorhynchus anatinus]|uniref:Coiled-coil domain containing 30 n=1 Tax=Ornithorhynchus anatinus TaxID=9258 RepID=A0A6I8N1P9_ORNAN|nr:coiled-coil domain-containing protein 30 isoform X2 [Ornithorhynchus anatinus]
MVCTSRGVCVHKSGRPLQCPRLGSPGVIWKIFFILHYDRTAALRNLATGMEKATLEKVQLEDVLHHLRKEGIDPHATAEEQLCYVWSLFQHSEGRLRSATQDLEDLKLKQAEEMKEVENYVTHIRNLTEEREALTTDFEKEKEQLKLEVQGLQLQREAQLKEVEEMLDREDLPEIAHSSPSEQIAYLLVERTALLEKLELADPKLESSSHEGSGLPEVHHQGDLKHARQTLEAELQQQRESTQRTRDILTKCHYEELEKEKTLRKCVERDVEEATGRLQMAHQEIRRLTDELDSKRKEQSKLELALESAQQEIKKLEENMSKYKDSDSVDLQKAKERNQSLDKEILALHSRVQTLDSERNEFVELVAKLKEEIRKYQENEKAGLLFPRQNASLEHTMQDKKNKERKCFECEADPNQHSHEMLHKRCQKAIEERECRNAELLYKLQKLEREHEDLVERNEELESILGETQCQTKEEREYFECETERLQRKISSLEAELSKVQKGTSESSQETVKKVQDFQEILKMNQEKMEILESKLSEEREWRQQLVSDLDTAQKGLKARNEELQNSESELMCLYKEIQRAAEDQDFLNATHAVLQRKNSLLKIKVLKLSRDYEQLSLLIMGEKAADKCFLSIENPFKEPMTKAQILEEQSPGTERRQFCAEVAGSNKHVAMEDEVKGDSSQKERQREERLQVSRDVHVEGPLGCSTSEEVVSLSEETSHLSDQFLQFRSSGDSTDDSSKQPPSGEASPQQQREELQQLRQDFLRIQNLCSSAERELRYERGKSSDLKQHNALLQQENTKVKAELKQVQLKLSESTKMYSSLTGKWEHCQQNIKELELEVRKQTEKTQSQNDLEEQLSQEKARFADAEKMRLELQQNLKDSLQKFSRVEVEKNQLMGKMKEARENEEKLKQHYQEEQQQRKFLDQTIQTLQQQIQFLRDRETLLEQTVVQQQLKIKEHQALLQELEDEKKISDEHLHCQKNRQKLSEQLSALQQEKETQHEKYSEFLNQFDAHVRKYNEKQLHLKAKVRRAKESFVHEVRQRDDTIKQLEHEIEIMRKQLEKGEEFHSQIIAKNETLLRENWKLLDELSVQEEVAKDSKLIITSIQNRVFFLDEENKRLQEGTLRLSQQVSLLERILRNIHSSSVEEITLSVSSGCQLFSKNLPLPPVSSFSAPGLIEPLKSLKASEEPRSEEATGSSKTSLSVSESQCSEAGYLNVASPEGRPGVRGKGKAVS